MRREVILPVDPTAPMLARHALNSIVPPPDLLDRHDDVRLAVSEIVTNAVQHAGLIQGRDTIRLVFEREHDHVRVEVEQDSSTARAHPSIRPPGVHGGWGLPMVSEVADDWGTQPGPPGVVWFEFRA